MRDFLLYVDGAWCPGGAGTMPATSPSTGERFASVAVADAADVDRAVKAARAARDGLGSPFGLRAGGMLRLGRGRHQCASRRARPCPH